MAHVKQVPDEELSISSLYSYPGAIMQLLTISIIAGLFLLTGIPHMDSFNEMDPSNNLASENKAFLFVFNAFCYINISTALIGVVKAKGERLKIATVGLIAGGVCLAINCLIHYLF